MSNNFGSTLNQWTEKIQAKTRVIEWLRSLDPEDFSTLLLRLAKTAMIGFAHDQERFDKTCETVATDFEALGGPDWHIKRRDFDWLEKTARSQAITLSFHKNNAEDEGRFYINDEPLKSGKTLIEAIAKCKRDWEE